MRDTKTSTPHQNPCCQLGPAVFKVQQGGGDGGERFDFFEGHAECDEAEACAGPGQEGAFAGEEVAGEGAGVWEGGGVEEAAEEGHCGGRGGGVSRAML